MYGRIVHGDNSFAPQPDFGAGLGAGLYLADNRAVQSLNLRFAAENGGGKGNPDGGVHVHVLSFIAGFLFYMDLQQKISGLPASIAEHAFALQADGLSVRDACGNPDFQRLDASLGGILKMNHLFTAESGLFKGDLHICVQILAVLAVALAAAAAEAPAEKAVVRAAKARTEILSVIAVITPAAGI